MPGPLRAQGLPAGKHRQTVSVRTANRRPHPHTSSLAQAHLLLRVIASSWMLPVAWWGRSILLLVLMLGRNERLSLVADGLLGVLLVLLRHSLLGLGLTILRELWGIGVLLHRHALGVLVGTPAVGVRLHRSLDRLSTSFTVHNSALSRAHGFLVRPLPSRPPLPARLCASHPRWSQPPSTCSCPGMALQACLQHAGPLSASVVSPL